MRTLSINFSEDHFIERLKSAEQPAYAELYDRYSGALFSAILKIVGSRADAENLLQDVFVKIWRNMEKYEPGKGRLFTWLLTIARNTALDFVRSKNFSVQQKIQSVETAVHIESPSPEIEKLDFVGLESVLAKLEPNLRQVIDLQYFMGYSQQDIADEFNIPLGTVKSRTRACLIQLRTLLKVEQ